LILEARSLLWAIDPLQNTPEGGVVIQVAAAADAERLQAQLQVLDSLQRPRILQGSLEVLAAGVEPGEQFEWIAARQALTPLAGKELDHAIDQLDRLAAPTAQLRLLFSQPALGPIAALLATDALSAQLRQRLEPVQTAEATWLENGPERPNLERGLEKRGWQLHWQAWQEPLQLTLSEPLIQRWLGTKASYRRQLTGLVNAADLQQLEAELRRLVGLQLPQQLKHRLLVAGRSPATQSAT
jgi:putative ATPase